ncbi:SDR family oxidoreductase [Ktedonospora formicarum]|uniref:Dehydrogenase n=1 Tax=Ktedonospora formicarum TaxID=2778364 RepID=A0A8J3IBV0_9CHLR|nr:SDR family oxidoreductase [Ktedonospora formicarum]GHO50415.1 dehydrogenase [Ktedonospora formicarum]
MSEGKKIALVTGANKGIGFEIARQLGIQDITILVGARDLARGEAAIQKLRAEKIEAVVVHLDVTNQVSIDAAAAFIGQTYGRLDILVNNAAIAVREWSTPPSQLSFEDLQKTFATNVFGVFAVTKAMLPLLRHSQAGRIVNVSSEMGSLSINSDAGSPIAKFPPTLAYNASKTALNALTVFFAKELQGTPIKVNSVSPGYVATDLNGHSGYLTAEQGAKAPIAYATLPADGPTGGFFGVNGQIAW